MLVVIRADASVEVGTGHVMRCLALAEKLRLKGATIQFLCRRLPGDLVDFISQQYGFASHALGVIADDSGRPFDWAEDLQSCRTFLAEFPQKPDWILADHYQLDRRWESGLRPWTKNLMVIDDLANRPHECDLLLDQNLYHSSEARYRGLVPDPCALFIGPHFSLLREEFLRARTKRKRRDGIVRRILVFFGGSDPGDETTKALKAFLLLKADCPSLEVDVVVGASNPRRFDVEQACRTQPGIHFHCQAQNMADLMAQADLAFGAGGTSTWERCCVGLPSLVVVLAENQKELAENAESRGVLVNLGRGETLDAKDYVRAFRSLVSEQLLGMEEKCLELVDGRGCDRIADAILQGLGK